MLPSTISVLSFTSLLLCITDALIFDSVTLHTYGKKPPYTRLVINCLTTQCSSYTSTTSRETYHTPRTPSPVRLTGRQQQAPPPNHSARVASDKPFPIKVLQQTARHQIMAPIQSHTSNPQTKMSANDKDDGHSKRSTILLCLGLVLMLAFDVTVLSAWLVVRRRRGAAAKIIEGQPARAVTPGTNSSISISPTPATDGSSEKTPAYTAGTLQWESAGVDGADERRCQACGAGATGTGRGRDGICQACGTGPVAAI